MFFLNHWLLSILFGILGVFVAISAVFWCVFCLICLGYSLVSLGVGSLKAFFGYFLLVLKGFHGLAVFCSQMITVLACFALLKGISNYGEHFFARLLDGKSQIVTGVQCFSRTILYWVTSSLVPKQTQIHFFILDSQSSFK